MQFREHLTYMIAGLQSSKVVIVDDFYLGTGLEPDAIGRMSSERGIRLAASVLDFYSQVNGAVIQWRCNPDAVDSITLRKDDDVDRINGLVYLYTLDEMLEDWTNLHNTPFDEGMEDKSRLASFHPFDKNVEEAFAGFVVHEGVIENRMYYLRQYEELIPFEASLETYITALLQSRGFLWWQDSFASRPAGASIDDLYYYVPQLFSGETLPVFQTTEEW